MELVLTSQHGVVYLPQGIRPQHLPMHQTLSIKGRMLGSRDMANESSRRDTVRERPGRGLNNQPARINPECPEAT